MKRTIQIGVVLSLMLIGLSSGLMLNTGQAHSSITDGQVFQLSAANPVDPRLQPESVREAGPYAQAEAGANKTVAVSGSGQVSARPDQAVIRVGVQTDAESAEAALSQNNTKMQALLNSLKQAGVAPEDIQTTNLQLQPRYQNQPEPQSGPLQIAGYTASNTVMVTVRNVDQVGQMLDAAVTAGGNTIEGIQFGVSDPSGLLDQAREAAMQDARHKAEQLATLAGARLGDVLTIQESSGLPQPVAPAGVAFSVASVPVEPGSESLTVEVQVTWLLQ